MAVQAALSKSPARPDTLEIHSYVMDNECNFIRESVKRVAFQEPLRLQYTVLLDGKNGNGKSLPMGENYIHTVVRRSGDAVDTAYEKIGYVKDRCSS